MLNPSGSIPGGATYCFEGKSVIVTGSARGIGKTIASAFGRAGAHVAICDINVDDGEQTVLELREAGCKATFFRVDLAAKGEPQRMVEEVADRLGGLDFLVNNARAGERLDFSEDTEDNWDLTLSVGLRAACFASRRAIDIMGSRGGGSIVNIGSVSAILVSHESAAYHAAKAGMLQITRYLAVQAGSSRVRVNSILPGFIVQDEHQERYRRADNAAYRERVEQCHPLKREGRSEDVANAALFLCSESAGFITGQEIIVDGGFTTRDPWAVLTARNVNP